MNDAVLRSCYSACDIFLLPSAGEGFGIVYLEAMAFAKPVIAADSAGAPFVVRPGVSGVLVAYGDPRSLASAVAKLAGDPDGARHVVVGELLGSVGRKTFTAATLYDSDGTALAAAEHVWITVDPAAFN